MRIPKNAVNFKGTKDGIIALIDLSYSFNTVIKAIEKKISEREDFFRGGTIKFLPTIGTLTDIEKSEIENLLQNKFNINSEFIMKEDFEKRKIGEEKRISEKEFLIVRKILRSGQSIEFHGNVILIGDVNEGAEIKVGGSLFVFGILRGSVTAGLETRKDAIVVATNLKPERLQIGDYILNEDISKRKRETVSVALVENENIVIYPYKSMFKL
ncbi:MAG TPA: septum site-determining protein MinC [Caldisericia bacterium]|nr:septum site-determining protein MinC [Caldisericia bacterium]HOL82440.1 septum site-determining protein MinC [Caldisericia bacterium]HPC57010.1 septum site-determining protein MinC [Caldisericia bacterium]HPP43187.1 septum site-determining protein MinC [Caldisericia bacterium]HRT37400.1 septum site-determining protein MinC [Caldisericia bacterium]